MTTTEQPRQQQESGHPVATGVAVAVQVEAIRRLYVTATMLVLRALRTAAVQTLRRPANGFHAGWRLDRIVRALAAQLGRQSRKATATLIATAQRDGTRQAGRDLGATGRPDIPADIPGPPELGIDHQAIAARVGDAHRRIMRQAIADDGNHLSRKRAMQRALDEFAERGISVFTDRAGREWSLDAYVEMSVRTIAADAHRDAYLARAKAAGEKFVQVSHSDTCCPLCLPYDGKIIAIADLRDAREAGLFHPNCRHRLSIVKRDAKPIVRPAPDPARYEAQQRLRYLERRVRAAKRRLAVALDDQARRKATAEVNAGFAAIREHIVATGITRQRAREQLNRPR